MFFLSELYAIDQESSLFYECVDHLIFHTVKVPVSSITWIEHVKVFLLPFELTYPFWLSIEDFHSVRPSEVETMTSICLFVSHLFVHSNMQVLR